MSIKLLLAKITAVLVACGPWGVLLLGLIDSIGVPLPAAMDALLILIAAKTPGRANLAASLAVLGSSAVTWCCSWRPGMACGGSREALGNRKSHKNSVPGSIATA